MVYITNYLYTNYISVDLAYHEKLQAKVGKGGIKAPSWAVFFGSR